jgi:hypothetical protein
VIRRQVIVDWKVPSTQVRGTLLRLAKAARDSRVSPETAAGDAGARRRSSSSKALKGGGMSIFDHRQRFRARLGSARAEDAHHSVVEHFRSR